MNYDPNMVTCGKKVKHTVRLAFASWDYRLEMTATVGGNILGADVLDSALDNIIDRAMEESEDNTFSITLSRPNGDTLVVDESLGDPEEELRKMLIGFEVLSVVPDGRFDD